MQDVQPLDKSLLPTNDPPSLSDIELDERHMDYARRRWPDKSPRMQAYNVRRSIWATLQHAKPHPDDPNRSRLGGPQPGSGRKPQKAIGRAIVEHFEGRTTEVLNAIAAPLAPNSGATPMERHKAGMNIAKHAREEEREAREADEYARQTDDEVRRAFAQMLAEQIRNGDLSLDDIIEGSATDVTDESKQIAS